LPVCEKKGGTMQVPLRASLTAHVATYLCRNLSQAVESLVMDRTFAVIVILRNLGTNSKHTLSSLRGSGEHSV
jgi:hypothetical protein